MLIKKDEKKLSSFDYAFRIILFSIMPHQSR